MLQKRVPSPPPLKDPSPPPSSSSTSSGEEEEEENHNTTDVSASMSSQPHRKPTSDLNQSPNSDSSIEEDDDDEEEEDTEDDRPTQPRKEKEDDEEEEDSVESSDSDSESGSPLPKVKSRVADPDPNVKPISSYPMEGAQKPKGAANPKVEAAASPASNPSPHKRLGASDSNEKESKKRQKPDLGEEDEEASTKKPLFQRIWSPEDEISLLKAMIEFRSDLSSDLTEFHEFVKKSLNVDMTKNQVAEKIRRMRRKYQNFAEKAMIGKEPSFSKAHDHLLFQLSKKIWGNDGEGENSVGKKGRGNLKKSKNKVDETVEPKSPLPSKSFAPKFLELNENVENHTPENHGLKNIKVLYPHLNDLLHSGGIVSVSGFGESDVKRALALMGDSRAKEWDERWMKLRSKEKDVYMERTTLVYELMKECYDLVKLSKT